MKRHPALQDLSRDHFQVLVRCQRFRKALAAGVPVQELRVLVEEFLRFFDSDMSPHFQEEDELVVPLALDHGHEALRKTATNVRQEHLDLRAQIRGLGAHLDEGERLRPAMDALQGRLVRHIEAEEAHLFEGVQRAIGAEGLDALGTRSRAFRARHRRASTGSCDLDAAAPE